MLLYTLYSVTGKPHLATEEEPWPAGWAGEGGGQVLSSDTSPLTLRAGVAVGA